ncbi:3-keto-5-aminohexanoate cleavage protein [Roseibium limicola]|nr:3-keto-5-aminohexanoate cleavage protein [Roseibium limicola]
MTGVTEAVSDAAQTKRVTDLCEQYKRPVATWQQAREMLGL